MDEEDDSHFRRNWDHSTTMENTPTFESRCETLHFIDDSFQDQHYQMTTSWEADKSAEDKQLALSSSKRISRPPKNLLNTNVELLVQLTKGAHEQNMQVALSAHRSLPRHKEHMTIHCANHTSSLGGASSSQGDIGWLIESGSSSLTSNADYELSSDFEQKQRQLLEDKYGGRVRANRAALVLQRAFRRYAMAKKFHGLLRRKTHASTRSGPLFGLDDPYGSTVAPKLRLQTYLAFVGRNAESSSSCLPLPLTKQLEMDRRRQHGNVGSARSLVYTTRTTSTSRTVVSGRAEPCVKSLLCESPQSDHVINRSTAVASNQRGKKSVCHHDESADDATKLSMKPCEDKPAQSVCRFVLNRCEESSQLTDDVSKRDSYAMGDVIVNIATTSPNKRRSLSVGNQQRCRTMAIAGNKEAAIANKQQQQPADVCAVKRANPKHLKILSNECEILQHASAQASRSCRDVAGGHYELMRCSSQGAAASCALKLNYANYCPVVRIKSKKPSSDHQSSLSSARVRSRGHLPVIRMDGQEVVKENQASCSSKTTYSDSYCRHQRHEPHVGTPSSDDSGVCSTSCASSSEEAIVVATISSPDDVWVPRDDIDRGRQPLVLAAAWSRRQGGAILSRLTTGHHANDAERKRHYRIALNFFNKKPERGIQFLMKWNFVDAAPKAVAKFLLSRKGLSKQMIGEYLGNLQNPFNMAVLDNFVHEVDIRNMEIDTALRHFQSLFRLPGEAQKIERIVEVFARRYCECNKETVKRLFKNQDTVFILSFAIIMLNTDLHSPNVKADRKMKAEDFVRNLRGVDGNEDIDAKCLLDLYARIKQEELKSGADHVTQVLKVERSIEGKKPTLATMYRRLVCYCRLFEIADVSKKQSLNAHQREIFLFNDMLLITKINTKKKNTISYTFRENHCLVGLQTETFKNHYYPFGLKISFTLDNRVLYFNARSEQDREKFVDDLREAVLESDEMEALRIELELEKQQHGVGAFAAFRSQSLGRNSTPKPNGSKATATPSSDKQPQRDSGVGGEEALVVVKPATKTAAGNRVAAADLSDDDPFSPRRLSAASLDSGMSSNASVASRDASSCAANQAAKR